jgi:hypothetical protein
MQKALFGDNSFLSKERWPLKWKNVSQREGTILHGKMCSFFLFENSMKEIFFFLIMLKSSHIRILTGSISRVISCCYTCFLCTSILYMYESLKLVHILI